MSELKKQKVVVFFDVECECEVAIYEDDTKWYTGHLVDRVPTVDELTELLDRKAEGYNRHEFVGCHGPLAKLISEHGGDDAAYRVMLAIAECGGLIEL